MREVTLAEACQELGISLSTLQRRIRSGDIRTRTTTVFSDGRKRQLVLLPERIDPVVLESKIASLEREVESVRTDLEACRDERRKLLDVVTEQQRLLGNTLAPAKDGHR